MALREIYDDDQSGFGIWCDEISPVMPEIGHALLFEVDRCALAPLGVLTRGVHLNGFVRTNGNISMWIAHLANRIFALPCRLDQIVGGFLPAGGDPVKQLTEEASAEVGRPRIKVRSRYCSNRFAEHKVTKLDELMPWGYAKASAYQGHTRRGRAASPDGY